MALDRATNVSLLRWLRRQLRQAEPLRERCKTWADQNLAALYGSEPELPPGMINRAAEVWWALLAIADLVGGEWPARARAAARALSTGGDDRDDRGDQILLLADLSTAFADRDTVTTAELLATLNALDESPWGARRRGEGLDARQELDDDVHERKRIPREID